MKRPILATISCSTARLLCCLSLLSLSPFAVTAAEPAKPPASFFFNESFEDARLLQRGWYDGDQFTIAAKEAHAGTGCIEFRWEDRGTTPANSVGMRRVFEPTETVHLRFHMKLSGLLQTDAQKALLAQITGPTPQVGGSTPPPPPSP
jgi:hypothetical protein